MLVPLIIAALAGLNPSVFVTHDAGNAWFISKAISRPMAKSVDGITLAQLNSARSERFVAIEPLCYVESVTRASIVGLDRAAQAEIEMTFASVKHDPFSQSFSTPDGRQFIARVAIYEECTTGKKGSEIVIYDRATRQIVDLQEWEGTPFRFLWPGDGPALMGHSSCFECGDSNALYYDVARKRFYWESEGD